MNTLDETVPLLALREEALRAGVEVRHDCAACGCALAERDHMPTAREGVLVLAALRGGAGFCCAWHLGFASDEIAAVETAQPGDTARNEARLSLAARAFAAVRQCRAPSNGRPTPAYELATWKIRNRRLRSRVRSAERVVERSLNLLARRNAHLDRAEKLALSLLVREAAPDYSGGGATFHGPDEVRVFQVLTLWQYANAASVAREPLPKRVRDCARSLFPVELGGARIVRASVVRDLARASVTASARENPVLAGKLAEVLR